MTTRLPGLLAILAATVVLLISTRVSSSEDVIELTNDNVVAYEQPCYNKATTNVHNIRGITTWCDVDLTVDPGRVYCTSTEEPTWCASSK